MRAAILLAVPFVSSLFALPASGPTAFEEPRFSFAFSYDANWIPAVQVEGESVSFTLSEGEVHVSAQRDPNPKHHKTRAALADDHIATWRNRLDFSELERKDVTLGTLPATLVTGTAKLFDAPEPYKLQLYVLERDGKLYVLKYSGLYDPSTPYWDGFNRMVKTFRFKDRSPGIDVPDRN